MARLTITAAVAATYKRGDFIQRIGRFSFLPSLLRLVTSAVGAALPVHPSSVQTDARRKLLPMLYAPRVAAHCDALHRLDARNSHSGARGGCKCAAGRASAVRAIAAGAWPAG